MTNLFEFLPIFCEMASSFSSPWPDPNSPVLSKIDFGVPLAELFRWLDVRDNFLGRNCKKQDIGKALILARDCKHPDAVWLTSIFEGKDVSTKERAREVFLSWETDARALCFAWFLGVDRRHDFPLLRRAAEMGCAFALSVLAGQAWFENKEEAFRLAQCATAHHERDGFDRLARCFRDGVLGKVDLSLAEENFLIAAELGHVVAAEDYGRLLSDSSPHRWLWWSRAALHGLPTGFLDSFSKQVHLFFSGYGNVCVVSLIGRALKGNINSEKSEIFSSQRWNFDSLVGPAKRAVSFYDSQIKSARLAVDTWTLVATRMHLIKDMRILIGKMVWEGRFDAKYKI